MSERILQVYEGGKIPVNISHVAEVKLLTLLGAGAFGTAWKVKDTSRGNLYVLKVIQGIEPGSVLADRVRLEAEVSIPSKHIIPVLGLSEWDPSTFLILFEFFPGKSLDKVLREERVAPQRKKYIYDQILVGVADAHQRNIIHRDLKPENILVGDDNLVKLIDFGISKFKGKGLTNTGDVMGTPPYMSPELLIYGSQISDARVDIYALGHILYEMSMGYTFWAKKGWLGNRFDEFVMFLSQEPKPIECIEFDDFSCDFYQDAADIIAQMVKTNPEERFATIEAVINALTSEFEIKSEISPKPDYSPPPVDPTPTNLPTFDLKYPVLIIESGTNRDALTLVNVEPGGSLILGRGEIAGHDYSISRKHLVFTRQGDRFFVNDLGSKNGTLLRGVALDKNAPPTELKNGDRLKVGEMFLYFVLPGNH